MNYLFQIIFLPLQWFSCSFSFHSLIFMKDSLLWFSYKFSLAFSPLFHTKSSHSSYKSVPLSASPHTNKPFSSWFAPKTKHNYQQYSYLQSFQTLNTLKVISLPFIQQQVVNSRTQQGNCIAKPVYLFRFQNQAHFE